jgi:tetratricopeptide (TPR) repeat protein
MIIRVRLPLLLAGALLFPACAPKSVAPPAAGPRYPDFVFPVAPAGVDAALAEGQSAAWQQLQSGDLRQAEREFSKLLKRSPAFYPAETGLAYVALARRDLTQASQRFGRALGRQSAYAPALAGQGQALLDLGRTAEGIASLQSAMAADPSLPFGPRIETLRFRDVETGVAAARKAAEAGRLDEARDAYLTALASSPDSAFLLRELGAVEHRAGRDHEALEHLRRAVALDPADARSLVLIADILESRGDVQGAIQSLEAARQIEPSAAVDSRIEALKESVALAALPAEYRGIGELPDVSRAHLAALVAVRLGELLKSAPRTQGVLITDTRRNWAAPWILAVVRAGVMDVFPNHTFQPGTKVRRSDLATVVSRLLALVAVARPDTAAAWRDVRPAVSDVSPGHLAYPAVCASVAAGVLPLLDDQAFGLARPVSGHEAIAAIDRIDTLARLGRPSR